MKSRLTTIVLGVLLVGLVLGSAILGQFLLLGRGKTPSTWAYVVTFAGYGFALGFIGLIVFKHLENLKNTPPFGELSGPSETQLVSSKDVQFTVYRPGEVRPETWYPLLAFAHLREKPIDGPTDEPDPFREVKLQAQKILSEQFDHYRDTTQDSAQPIPAAGIITFLPEMPGVEFNPPRRSFLWHEAVHREEFRLRASAEAVGRIAVGRMSVFAGSILVAEISLSLRVNNEASETFRKEQLQADSGGPYRKIFASYSHWDAAIVEQFENYAKALGDDYVRDVVHLRAGEQWDDRLGKMIADADVFQLFWSRNSMHSRFVTQEWEHALSLNRNNFIRPVYWEVPMPQNEAEGLPPEHLRRIHFQRILIPPASYGQIQGVPQPKNIRSRSPLDWLATKVLILTVPLIASSLAAWKSGGFRYRRVMPFMNPTSFGQNGQTLKMMVMATGIICLCASSLLLIPGLRHWSQKTRKGWSRHIGLILCSAFSLLLIIKSLVHLVQNPYFALLNLQFELPILLAFWLAYVWVRWVVLRLIK
jgi:hypothetical protein